MLAGGCLQAPMTAELAGDAVAEGEALQRDTYPVLDTDWSITCMLRQFTDD